MGTYIVEKGVMGVYALRHRPTGLIYVGGSGSCIYNRFRHHFVMLRKGIHATPKLQELWNNSQASDFEQLLLEICAPDQRRVREKYWIDHYKDKLLNGASDAARKRWSTPGYREAVSGTVKKLWQDPEYRSNQVQKSRESAQKLVAEGKIGRSTWTEESVKKWRRSMGYA